MVVHGSNPSIWEVEAECSGVQRQPQLCSEFEPILLTMSPCLRTNINGIRTHRRSNMFFLITQDPLPLI